VRKDGLEGQKLQTNLGALIAKARPELNKDIGDMKVIADKLAKFK
jgi:hypothetical protein